MPNEAQRRKIFGAAREVGLDREQLYDLVEQVSGARSISALPAVQTKQLIDLLVKAGARPGTPRPKQKPSGRRTLPGQLLLITPGQRELIEDLRRQLGGRWTEEEYFAGACRRRIRLPYPRTAGEATRVVEMLKQRLAHDRRQRR